MARLKTAQRTPTTAEPERRDCVPLTSPQPKFLKAREALCNSLVEREAEIDLVLTALIAKENPLLVGPPGVGKSLLLDSVARWVDSEPFDYLLTKFTDPMELFGPIDLNALKAGENKRNVDGYLPTATVSFLDEIWKGSSAILNTLLKILNERTFKFGKQRIKCPLVLCVAASNEWPNEQEGGKELGALFDRFLLRKTVKVVTKNGKRELLRRAVANDTCKAAFSETITPQEINLAYQEAMNLPWNDEAKKALWDILETLNAEPTKVFPGDRRIYKSVGVARASAYLAGAKEVLPEHLEILAHVLWEDPVEHPGKVEKVVARIANPVGNKILEILDQAQDVSAKSDEKFKASANPSDRSTIAQGVKAKLKELRNELRPYQPLKLPLCTQAVGWIDDMLKTWDYKELNMNRE